MKKLTATIQRVAYGLNINCVSGAATEQCFKITAHLQDIIT